MISTEYVLTKKDLSRLFKRVGEEKDLVRIDGFAYGDTKKSFVTERMGVKTKDNNIVVEYANTPCAIFYATFKLK